MGKQVAITLDSQLKPSYAVSTQAASTFTVEAGELVLFIGASHGGGKAFEVNGIKRCLELIRENGSVTPDNAKESYAKVAAPGRKNQVVGVFNQAPLFTLTGTVTVTIGTAAVVSVGTLFTTELAVGESIVIGLETHTILSITDNLNLTLTANHTAGAAGVAYAIAGIPAETDVGVWYGELFQPLDGSSITAHGKRAMEKYLESTQKAA